MEEGTYQYTKLRSSLLNYTIDWNFNYTDIDIHPVIRDKQKC